MTEKDATTEKGRGLAAMDLTAKLDELQGINALARAYGDLAWPVLRRQYLALGYAAGVEQLTRIMADGSWNPDRVRTAPVDAVREFLQGWFDQRDGVRPEVWAEETTVYLRTPGCRECLTELAEQREPVPHDEICYVYCRAWAEGYLGVLADLTPGLQINYHNLESRRSGPQHDCVEAFQVVSPRR